MALKHYGKTVKTFLQSGLFVLLTMLMVNVCQADRVSVGIGVGVPISPGPGPGGPVWVPGHWDRGYWIPGQYINYGGPQPGVGLIWYDGFWDAHHRWHRGYWGHNRWRGHGGGGHWGGGHGGEHGGGHHH